VTALAASLAFVVLIPACAWVGHLVQEWADRGEREEWDGGGQ
jgi:hypothetical protein